MSRNGTGTYVLPAGNPVVTGTTVSSTWANTTLSDISSALTQSIAADGQTPVTANLPMSGFRHTGVANANARTTYASAADVQDGTPIYLTSVSGTNTITATAAYTMAAYAAGQRFIFFPAAANTGATTINLNAIGAKSIFLSGLALTGGELVVGSPVEIVYDGTQFNLLSGSNVWARALRGHIAGLALANNGSDLVNDIDIAVGEATDSSGVALIKLTSGLTKQLDAVWAVGTNAGMRASGAAITNTTYHIFLIRRPDTGVVDVAADTSVTGANIAANTNAAYTQIRRIGSIIRSSGSILAFSQFGDDFLWSTVVQDVTATNPGILAVTRTLTVPTGIKVFAKFNSGIGDNSGVQTDFRVVISSLDQSDEAASLYNDNLGIFYGAGATIFAFERCCVRTNTSAQIRTRLSASSATTTLYVGTFGWVDYRGRFD